MMAQGKGRDVVGRSTVVVPEGWGLRFSYREVLEGFLRDTFRDVEISRVRFKVRMPDCELCWAVVWGVRNCVGLIVRGLRLRCFAYSNFIARTCTPVLFHHFRSYFTLGYASTSLLQ